MSLIEGKGGLIDAMNEELRTTGLDAPFVSKMRKALGGGGGGGPAGRAGGAAAAAGVGPGPATVVAFPRGALGADACIFTVRRFLLEGKLVSEPWLRLESA